MRKEQFALENVSVIKDEKNGFFKVTMHVYEEDLYGVICDSMEERNLMISFFSGKCELKGGSIWFGGKKVEKSEVSSLFYEQFSIIQKKSKLIHTLSISENICMFVDAGKMVYGNRYEEQTKEYLKAFDLPLQIQKPVRKLTQKERVMAELLKAFVENKKVIVLTELSGFLQQEELEEIGQLIRKIQEKHRTFILIEPFGDTIFSWTNRLLVIKNRKTLGCFETSFINREKLFECLSSKTARIEREKQLDTDEVLRFRDVSTSFLKHVQFRVAKGHLLKILCRDTQSLDEIRSVILGEEKKYTGSVCLNGQEIQIRNVMDMKKKGIIYCRERAYESMLVPDMSIRDNLMVDLSMKVSSVCFFKKYQKSLDAMIEENIGEHCAEKKLREFPAVQLQKVAFLKFSMFAPQVLFCEKPFAEMDLHMKGVTIQALEGLQNKGIAVVVLTTNLEDLDLLEGEELYLENGVCYV